MSHTLQRACVSFFVSFRLVLVKLEHFEAKSESASAGERHVSIQWSPSDMNRPSTPLSLNEKP